MKDTPTWKCFNSSQEVLHTAAPAGRNRRRPGFPTTESLQTVKNPRICSANVPCRKWLRLVPPLRREQGNQRHISAPEALESKLRSEPHRPRFSLISLAH